jgi:hypothetical protein
MKISKKITTKDIEYANERLMKMSKDELDELEKSPNYIHLTEDDIRKAGELAFKNVKKEVKKEKRNTIIIGIIAILILLFDIIFLLIL